MRRIEPAGSAARFETRTGDNHHHLVCRICGRTTDVDCAVGARPCLTPGVHAGYLLDEAEIVFWGQCSQCVYPDAHRYRIGANYTQLPVNAATSPVNSYSKDGAMRYQNPTDPVYAPNSYGGPHADTAIAGEVASTYGMEDEVIRSAYKLRSEDDDFGQPGTLVRTVMDDAQRERLVGNVSGHLLHDVSAPVLERAFQYWRNVDKETGDKIEQTVRNGAAKPFDK